MHLSYCASSFIVILILHDTLSSLILGPKLKRAHLDLICFVRRYSIAYPEQIKIVHKQSFNQGNDSRT